MMVSATAFAPASVGNVGIGFDILGFAVDALGDRVTVAKSDRPGVRILSSGGVAGDLPLEPERNTAGRALLALNVALRPSFGFEMRIEKGIPLGSGLGGSAASAVGAVVAANALLERPLDKIELLKFAMQGEAVASGSLHVDNIAPSLFGGLVLTVGIDNPRVKRLPVPRGIQAVIIHPHMFLSTREARSILKREVAMADFVWQTANLAGFISGCYTDDLDLIREGLNDVVIEPQRRPRGGGARLFHLGGRADHVRMGVAGQRRGCAYRHGRRVRPARGRGRPLGRARGIGGRARPRVLIPR
jgi:homoserine kinase